MSMTIKQHKAMLTHPDFGEHLQNAMASDIRTRYVLIELGLARITHMIDNPEIAARIEATITDTANLEAMIRLYKQTDRAYKAITQWEKTLTSLNEGGRP